jgi:energy-coupling factor transporter ATP-binding protein EcfA2
LDEPTSNLDTNGIAWYHKLVQRFGANKLLVICSNQLHEYEFCNFQLQIEAYK